MSGLLILSQPSLFAGFSNASDKQNVGVHEFAHVVEQEEVQHGLPSEVPEDVIREWAAFVARELKHPEINKAHMNPYGYIDEHELLAVLTEYFFKSPANLRQRDPSLYDLMRKLFHQDPASLLSHLQPRRRTGRNAPCPCGSGRKFKHCCGRVLNIHGSYAVVHIESGGPRGATFVLTTTAPTEPDVYNQLIRFVSRRVHHPLVVPISHWLSHAVAA